MFSITTIASSTTKPVAMVSAISVRLLIEKPGEVHDAERADQRQRHRDARDERGRDVAQEQEDHHHDQRDREQQLELHVAHRAADRDRAVGQQRHVDRGRQRRLQLRQQLPSRGRRPRSRWCPAGAGC